MKEEEKNQIDEHSSRLYEAAFRAIAAEMNNIIEEDKQVEHAAVWLAVMKVTVSISMLELENYDVSLETIIKQVRYHMIKTQEMVRKVYPQVKANKKNRNH